MIFFSSIQDKESKGLDITPSGWLSRLKEPVIKKKVLIIAGPTAIGKTAMSFRLAEMLEGEIISADSMQVYRGMDIGTAKPSLADRERVPHHLIDICNIEDPFNVAQFYKESQQALSFIFRKGATPIVVGGTGFYVHAFIYGPPSGPPSVPHIREKIEKQLDELGPHVLYEKLKNFDPDYASKITPLDRHKIVRGLEIISITGLKVTEFASSSPELTKKYDFRCWFLYRPLEELYKKIEERCDIMMQGGLLEEVQRLELLGLCKNSSAAQAIGYRQCLQFLHSSQTKSDFQTCVTEFKKASRHYARRQFTWFRKEPLFRWLNVSSISMEQAAEIIAHDFEAS